MKFSIKGFSSKFEEIRSFLRLWSHLATEEIFNGKFHFFVQCMTIINTISDGDIIVLITIAMVVTFIIPKQNN